MSERSELTGFLDEVARLLPDADVVHLGVPDATVDPLPGDVARARCRDELRRVAATLVAGWPRWLPTVGPPDQLSVQWSTVERADHVHVEVTGRAPGEHDVDVAAAGVALEASGWQVVVQDQGGRDARVIGVRATDRVELVVRPSEHVVVARVIGTPIAVGELAPRLVAAGRRELPRPGGASGPDTA